MLSYLVQRKMSSQFRGKVKKAVFYVAKNNRNWLNALFTKHNFCIV